jgi:hypothetical protein
MPHTENGQATAEKKFKPTDEIGATGLVQFGGRVQEEFLKDLQDVQGRRIYRQMADNDPVVGAILFTVDMLMRQVEWRLDPVDESVEAYEVAEFVESCLSDMSSSWAETLSSVLSFLPFGWSYHELVYKVRRGLDQKDVKLRSKYDDGRIGWRKIAVRSQDTLYKWEFDDDGGTKGMWQQSPPTYELVFIPIEKALLFRTQAHKGNPEGRSILRNAYRPWFFKSRLEEVEAIGMERDLAGLPIAWVPASMLADGATPAETATLGVIKDLVATIKRDEQDGVVFPLSYDEHGNKRYDLTLLSTGGRRQFDTDGVISRYDQRIAMSVLADFILLGHENVGSFALGSSKIDLFGTALGTFLDEVAAVFNRYALPRLMELNDIEFELQPTLSHADVKHVDLTEIAAYLQSLSAAGMPLFPDPGLEEHLRTIANFPEHDPDAEVSSVQSEQPIPGQPGAVPPGVVPPVAAPPKGVTPPQLQPSADAAVAAARPA